VMGQCWWLRPNVGARGYGWHYVRVDLERGYG
jgi:hypothetical protein